MSNGLMIMNGTLTVKDLVTNLPFTKTGGVGGAWTDESNFDNLLGMVAPVCGDAINNLFDVEDESFEGGTVGNWAGASNCSLAVSTDEAFHGSYSLKCTVTADALAQFLNNVTAITSAGTEYTVTAKIKTDSGRTYRIAFWDDVVASQYGSTITGDGTWQTVTATKTFDAGSAGRRIYFQGVSAITDDIIYLDAFQIIEGDEIHPFAYNSRTGTACTIPTPFEAGEAVSFVAVVYTDWPGSDAYYHYFFSASDGTDGIMLYKGNSGNLIFTVYTGGAAQYKLLAVDTGNWLAYSTHIIVCTVDEDNNQQLYVDGVEATSSVGTEVRETALNSNLYLGSSHLGTLHINAPIFLAVVNGILSDDEITAISAEDNWADLIDTYCPIAVTGASPESAHIGDTITINGDCFGDEQGSSYVTIGGSLATIVSWTNNTIQAIVPEVNINVNGDVSVTVTIVW